MLADQRRGEPVVEIGHFHAGLPFYLGQPVPLVEVPREAGFEDPGARARILVPRDSVRIWAARHGRVWAFGRAAHVREIADQQGLGYVPIARWRKEALVLLTATP